MPDGRLNGLGHWLVGRAVWLAFAWRLWAVASLALAVMAAHWWRERGPFAAFDDGFCAFALGWFAWASWYTRRDMRHRFGVTKIKWPPEF